MTAKDHYIRTCHRCGAEMKMLLRDKKSLAVLYSCGSVLRERLTGVSCKWFTGQKCERTGGNS